ncbi:hypothetical protein GCM10010313_13700 [Streptomyces violarus]|nr:hypothetical protein GCM10010313_13700 [Streptomyces violarus]
MHYVGERQELMNSTWLCSDDLGERTPAFDRCVELRTLLLIQPSERQMITLARCESREVEPGSGQHGHASEAAPVCGHRQTGVAEPVQISGDGSKGHPER